MLYNSTVWSNTSTQNINKLQSIQNFASKIVTNSRKFDQDVTPLLHQLNWLPVKQLLYYRDSVLTYKCFKGVVPKHLVGKRTKRSSIHARHTRKRDYYIYHCITLELLLANAHSHIEGLVFGTVQIMI